MPKNFKAWPTDWPISLNYPEIPIYAFLEQTAARAPHRIAIHFGGMELTYGELGLLSKRFAAALIDLGVKKGDRVAIQLVNSPQFAIAYYAILMVGATFTPLSPLASQREARYQLSDAGAETLISLDLIYPGVAPILKETPVKRVITSSIADCYNAIIAPLKPLGKIPAPETIDFADLLKKYEPLARPVAIEPKKDLAHLAYTGGTTGVSKGVMLTHFNVVTNVLQTSHWFFGAQIGRTAGTLELIFPEGIDPQQERLALQDTEVALVVVPWFHAMGTVGYLNCQIYQGNTMVVFPRFDPTEYLTAIKKYQATVLGGAPQLYIPLVNHPDFKKYDLSGIKLAASGAAPLAREVLDQLREAFSGVVLEAYGLTECTMGATYNPPSREATRPGSVGLPVFDTEIKIVDPATGQEQSPGAEGEICIQGPQIMQGYWNQPQATAEVLNDGWLFTGDIGRVDEDGFLFITDRKKDMIIYKGYNVYPREIEELIFRHPAVAQCAVVGRPDQAGGEAPVSFVELKKGMTVTGEEIIAQVNAELAHYKKLREVIFVETIPVSAAGKVLKRELRDRLKKDN